MNILITGSNGFIATELINRFEKENWVTKIFKLNRQNSNLLDFEETQKIFNNNKIDFVIHCAISGGRRGMMEDPKMFYDNVAMFENLASQRHKFKGMINFGSGAEAERTKGIMIMKEEQFLSDKQIPSDYYGFSKYMIAKRIQQINDNIYNFRIFNVFGELEKENRMIKNNINRYKAGKPLEIHQNKTMDFFSAEDLYRVIRYYIKNCMFLLDKDINMCYINKVDLKQICSIIGCDSNPKIVFNCDGMAPAYCGNGMRLKKLKIDLVGLEGSIESLMEK